VERHAKADICRLKKEKNYLAAAFFPLLLVLAVHTVCTSVILTLILSSAWAERVVLASHTLGHSVQQSSPIVTSSTSTTLRFKQGKYYLIWKHRGGILSRHGLMFDTDCWECLRNRVRRKIFGRRGMKWREGGENRIMRSFIICIHHHMRDEINDDMGGTCSTDRGHKRHLCWKFWRVETTRKSLA
jgi:hypothetical protein